MRFIVLTIASSQRISKIIFYSTGISISYPEFSGQSMVARRDMGELEFCGKTMQAVTEQLIKKFNFFDFHGVSPGDQPPAKESEDSGYEIGIVCIMVTLLALHHWSRL